MRKQTCSKKDCTNLVQNPYTKRVCRECHNAYMRERRKVFGRSPEEVWKNKARNKAQIYQKRGKLIPQPCELCGDIKVEKHHDDYTKALDVRWLCRPCHMNHHAATDCKSD